MKKICVLMFLVMLPILNSHAQDRRDQGRRDQDRQQILRADYGAGNSWVDVTQRVLSMIRGNQLDFRVGNDVFGTDPRPGKDKVLRLQIRTRGGDRQLIFKEGQSVDLRGYSDSSGLQIIRGLYGSGNRTVDVTGRLNSQMRGGQINLPVSNDTMGGDPARGQDKTLTVWYSIDGRSLQVSLREGEYLNLPGGPGNGPGNGGGFNGGNNGGGYGGNNDRNNDRQDRGLRIVRAQYGAGGRLVDVTARVSSQMQRDQISMRVSNDTMGGDPAGGMNKALTVQFVFNGRPGQVVVAEGEVLNLPQ